MYQSQHDTSGSCRSRTAAGELLYSSILPCLMDLKELFQTVFTCFLQIRIHGVSESPFPIIFFRLDNILARSFIEMQSMSGNKKYLEINFVGFRMIAETFLVCRVGKYPEENAYVPSFWHLGVLAHQVQEVGLLPYNQLLMLIIFTVFRLIVNQSRRLFVLISTQSFNLKQGVYCIPQSSLLLFM